MAWIAGEKGWLEQRIELAARDKPHEVKWNYSKDKSDAAGCDCGWLKDVVWTPEAVCHVTVSSLYGEPTGGGEYACGTTVVLDAPLLPMPSQTFDGWEGWFMCRGSSGSPVLTNRIEFVKLPRHGTWFFTYGTDRTKPLSAPEKEGDLPTGIWARLNGASGMMLILR